MKTAAIISEYNPFHNGHQYQIRRIRELFGEDCAVVAIMSGHFVQRGGPALLDKWARARSALLCGADLVIELPAAYATSSAELFAAGGIAAAAATGVCGLLVFGSESGDLDALQAAADVLADEPASFRDLLRLHLDEGLSFPVSRSLALEESGLVPGATELLSRSNNILAVEYLKALRRRGITHMKPFTVRREGQDYNTASLDGAPLASASAIRAFLQPPSPGPAAMIAGLSGSMPEGSLAILLREHRTGNVILSGEAFAGDIFRQLLTRPAAEISGLPGMGEGLGNRLKELASRNTAGENRLERLVSEASTRRYPRSRVRRALSHMLLGITGDDLAAAAADGAPYYLRVLGSTGRGRYLLRIMRKTAALPIITRGSDFLEFPSVPANAPLRRMAALDFLATDIWTQQTTGICGRDYTTPPLTL